MVRKEKFVVLFTLMIVGFVLILASQVRAQPPQGNFGEVVFDQNIKVIFDPYTGDVTDFCTPCDNGENCGNCGEGWVSSGVFADVYILPTGLASDARLISSVGPRPGCACYNQSPCFWCQGGVVRVFNPCPW